MLNRRSNWFKAGVALLVVLLVSLIVAIVLVRREYTANLRPASASQQNQLFTIESGATAREIAMSLEEKGLIRSTWAFEWYVRNNGLRDKLQAGSFYLRSNMSVQEIVDVLTQGKVATDLVTILPGQRIDQIRKGLINSGFTPADVDTALNPELYKDHPALVDKPAGASLEGYLYPESFQKTATTKPQQIIRNSLDLTHKYLTPDVRAALVARGLTVHQGIILASIVEMEVGNPNDRPVVAQVFLKRFQIGMQLGSDVTSVYGAINAGHSDYSVSESIAFDSPYNTRIHSGLPPGPISNISNVSLRAVAFPAKTDYLFFVAGDDGVTYFSNTQAEHEALTRQHCKKLCSL